jgi:hypothetical protein
MEILKKVPLIIKEEPMVTVNVEGIRFAVIDYIMYLLDDDIEEEDLIRVWLNHKNKNKDKTFYLKSKNETTKVKLIDNFEFKCECDFFKNNGFCEHINKIKKYFLTF